MKKMR